MSATQQTIRRAIVALQAQRVRQDNVMAVLDCLIAQAYELGAEAENARVREAITHMRERAFELRGIARSVPKFVVEDVLAESIALLKTAEQDS